MRNGKTTLRRRPEEHNRALGGAGGGRQRGLIILCGALCGLAFAVDRPGFAESIVPSVWFQATFEEEAPERGWSGPTAWGPDRLGGRALAIERGTEGAGGTAVVTRPLPVEPVRGCLIRGTAWVRAEAVSAKPRPWNGIKFMLAVQTPDRQLWPQAEIDTGSFDWRRVAFTARIPSDTTAIRLVLGLEEVTGRVWFDEIRLEIAARARTVAVESASAPYKGHSLPRLRGTMVSPNIDPEGLRVLGRDWNANLIRWQLVRHAPPGERPPLDTYDSWLEGELKKLEAALPWCERYGLYVVVDLHSPPGGRAIAGGYVAATDGLFTDPRAQAKLVEVWERIARRFRGHRAIWGYDLVNEPVEDFVAEGCEDWPALAERVARAIRAVDPVRTLIVEPSGWGGPAGFVDFVPLGVSNVVYSVHMYEPHAFTHQGVYEQGQPVRYPGFIGGRYWDKARLATVLGPVREFQRRYGVHIYVGEFSAIRWAPEGNAARYLRDLIDLFETWGWDWSYHAFREWHGWSVEHGEDRANLQPAPVPTERQRLLQDWFARNEKPRW